MRFQPEELLESISEAFYALDSEGRFTYVNGQAAELWQCSPADLLGKSIHDVFPSLRDSEVYQAYQEALQGGEPVSRECPSPTRKGWIALTVRPHAEGLMVFFRDIAGPRQMAADLQEHVERLKQLNSLCREGVIVHNDHQVLDVNESFLRMLGFSYEEALGLRDLGFVAPECRQEVAERVRTDFEGAYETIAVRKDGSRIPVEVHSRRCVFHGEPARVTTLWNLSTVRQAEQERLRLMAQLEAVLEQLPAGVIITDPVGGILRANEFALRLFGAEFRYSRSVEEYEEWHPHRADGTPYRPEEVPIARALRTGEIVAGEEMRIPLADGSWRHLSINAAPIRDARGEIVAGVITIDDLSERKHAEQLELAIREAHHRIKNNLQAITDLLSLELFSARTREVADPLRESMERVQAIAVVHDLLSRENVEMVNVPQLAEKLIRSLVPTNLPGGPVEVLIEIPPLELPSRQATALALILNELLSNAFKYALSGGRRELVVRLTVTREEICLMVRDYGPGLPPGFDLERHADVGLQMVQGLTESNLGGTLALQSRDGLIAEVRFPR
ncbi:MAG: PAS domain S-box protein [Armatimonadota bacterium]